MLLHERYLDPLNYAASLRLAVEARLQIPSRVDLRRTTLRAVDPGVQIETSSYEVTDFNPNVDDDDVDPQTGRCVSRNEFYLETC